MNPDKVTKEGQKDAPLNATQYGDIRIPLQALTPRQIGRIKSELGYFTGGEHKSAAVEADKLLVIPRATAHLCPINIEDKTCDGESLQDSSQLVRLRGYQQQAVDAMVQHGSGVVVAPCGSGKTTFGIAAIRRLGRRALVLVHTIDLAEQWRERVRQVLGIEAGVIGDGGHTEGPVTVALMQSLIRMDSFDLDDIGLRYGTIVIDESHKVPCDTLQQLLAYLPGKHRFGLTATPERTDGQTPLLFWSIGPEICRITQEQLIEDGHLLRPEVVTVETGWNIDAQGIIPEVRRAKAIQWQMEGMTEAQIQRKLRLYQWDGEDRIPDWLLTEIYSYLTTDESRNNIIKHIACRQIQEGRTVLILSQRVNHCVQLAKSITEAGYEAHALTGKLAKKKRAALLEGFKSGTIPCLCATQLADEGLDVPRLDRVILACPSRSAPRAIQRLGRLMRPCEGKDTPRLFDLVDDFKTFQSQARSRLRAYREALGGFEHRNINMGGRIRGVA